MQLLQESIRPIFIKPIGILRNISIRDIKERSIFRNLRHHRRAYDEAWYKRLLPWNKSYICRTPYVGNFLCFVHPLQIPVNKSGGTPDNFRQPKIHYFVHRFAQLLLNERRCGLRHLFIWSRRTGIPVDFLMSAQAFRFFILSPKESQKTRIFQHRINKSLVYAVNFGIRWPNFWSPSNSPNLFFFLRISLGRRDKSSLC